MLKLTQLLGVTQSGTMLFSCKISGGFTSEDGPLEPPSWAIKTFRESNLLILLILDTMFGASPITSLYTEMAL